MFVFDNGCPINSLEFVTPKSPIGLDQIAIEWLLYREKGRLDFYLALKFPSLQEWMDICESSQVTEWEAVKSDAAVQGE